MLVTFLLVIPLLALVWIVYWGMSHETHPHHTRLSLDAFSAHGSHPASQVPEPTTAPVEDAPKQTPATTRAFGGPVYIGNYRGTKTGFSLSGVGPSNWSFQHRLVPKHYRRHRHLDPSMFEAFR